MASRTSPSKPLPSIWAVVLFLASCAFSAGAVALLVREAYPF